MFAKQLTAAQSRDVFCECHIARYKRELLVATELGDDVSIRKARFCVELWERALEYNQEGRLDFAGARHCDDCHTYTEGHFLCPNCGKVQE